MASVHIHDAEFELAQRTRNFATTVDGNFLAGNGINTNLAAEKERIDIAAQGEIEYPGILQKELPLFWKEELVGREIKLLRVDIDIGEVRVGGEIGHQIRAQAELDVDATGVERARSGRKTGARIARRKMAESRQSVRLDDEQASTADVGNSLQLASMTDPRGTIDAPPGRPEIFFIFAPDKTFKVDAPSDIARLHEIQGGKWDSHGGRPTPFCNTGFGGPDSVPSRVAIASAGICALLFGNQSVALRAQRINLKHVRIAPVVSRVDDDLEVVIQFLADIPSQFGCNNPFRIRVKARNAEIDFMLAVEDADFGFLGRCLPLKWLALQKVGNRAGLLPCGIIERAIQFRRTVNPACMSGPQRFLTPKLPFPCLWAHLRLCVEDHG